MEMIDIIDENGDITGQTRDRKDVHKYGLLHHASGLIIVAKQKRGGVLYIISTALPSQRKERRTLGYVC